MDEADWNFTEQQAETVWTCEELRGKKDIRPHSEIVLDLFFLPARLAMTSMWRARVTRLPA